MSRSTPSLDQIKQGMDSLYSAIESLPTEIKANSLSGDHIDGGKYTNFQSTGIIDLAKNLILQVKDNGIHAKNLHVTNLVGDIRVPGSMEIEGELKFNYDHIKDEIYKETEEFLKSFTAKVDHTSIPLGGLTGNHIRGGTISGFSSTGIKDNATRLRLLVTDDGITVDNISSDKISVNHITSKDLNITANTVVNGLLRVNGEIFAEKVHVKEYTADTRLERTEPLQFHADEGSSIYNKGLLWVGDGATRQAVLLPNPDRFYFSENIDIKKEKDFSIGGVSVLSQDRLGDSVSASKLTKVGTLKNLKTQGSLCIDEYLYYNEYSNRLGFGVEEPNGTIGIASLDSDFIIDVEQRTSKVGNYSSTPLNIITDNVARIQISATGNRIVIGSSAETNTVFQGKLGVNVNSPDCDIVTAGPVKFEDKKFSVGIESPKNGVWNEGDIVWNQRPRPTSWIGWVCIRAGSPGEWKPFGQIGK